MKSWQTKDNKLFNEYKFNDYNQALNFVIEVSKLADNHNHHPDISFGWGYVQIYLYSHDKNAITQRDHQLADAISSL